MKLFGKRKWIPQADLVNRKDLVKYWQNPYDKKKQQQDAISLETDIDARMDIVGESFYQKTFIKNFGKHTEDGHHEMTQAILMPQPNNEHDEFAVGVLLMDGQVGYIEKNDAKDIQEILMRAMHHTQRFIVVTAQVKGGWKRGLLGRDKGNFGLELHIGKQELIDELINIMNDPKEEHQVEN